MKKIMNRIMRSGLILVAVFLLTTACQGKEKSNSEESSQDEEVKVTAMEEVDTSGDELDETEQNNDGSVSTLCTDDKSISITILRPEGFEVSEYSSEHQVAFQQLGEDGSSTQLNFRLMTEDESEAMTIAQQEVSYLLSANPEDTSSVGEVQAYPVGERQWSFFTYSTEGVEGLRAWTSLSNGCVVSCIVENLGNGMGPLSADSFLQIMDTAIQE